ncbi:MAG: carboxypeptidase-like regulatory domain-containing protein, partial [Chitinophagaceae bacterium]
MNFIVKRLPNPGKLSMLVITLLLLFIYNATIAADPAKGIVTDESGKPLEGVTITVKGNRSGTTSLADGTFTLNAPAGSILTISYIGYESQELATTPGNELKIILKGKSNAMDNVIVIGYGTQLKKDLTGAIGSISEKDIEASITTPDQALRGKVSGVQVHTDSHSPGGGISVQIRGTASISAGGSP